MVKQAIIPLAGLGTRMLPLTKALPKELWPLGSKSILEHILDECFNAGVKEVIFVISKNKNVIKHDLNKVKKDNQSKISNNNKLTYKLEYELSIIPSEIKKLETTISKMNNILSDADLYTKNIDKFLESSKTLEMSKKKLDELETRWLELDLQKNKL